MITAMARKKKAAAEKEPQKLFYLFYTQERWDNWLKTLGEYQFDGDPESEELQEAMQALSNFTEDITVSVLKIIKLYQNERFSKEESLAKLDEVEAIIMGGAPEGELGEIVEGIQLPLLVLFLSCKKYLNEAYGGDIKELVKEGRKVVEKDMERALETAGTIGALVIDGGSCCGKYLRDTMENPSIFDEWLIEIETMANAFKSLKKFDEEPGEAM
jgi:hypothetical protein